MHFRIFKKEIVFIIAFGLVPHYQCLYHMGSPRDNSHGSFLASSRALLLPFSPERLTLSTPVLLEPLRSLHGQGENMAVPPFYHISVTFIIYTLSTSQRAMRCLKIGGGKHRTCPIIRLKIVRKENQKSLKGICNTEYLSIIRRKFL